MSLFGNLLPKNQAASGAPPAKNLFGTAAPASSAPSTNLFGNLGGSTTTAPSSGLFGNLGTASSAQSGASQTGTTDGVGVNFANASNAQQKPSGTTGMFQPSTAQNASQSTATNPLQQTAAGTQPSLFAGGAAPQQQQQAAAPLSQSGAPATKNAHFDHLLERGRKRNAGENGLSNFEELPSLQLGLGDIARKVRNLGAGGPSADQTQDRTAHYLLSASGVKLGSTLRDLNQFSTQAGLSTAVSAANILDTDIEGYLSNLHSQSTLALIQEGLEQSKRDFDSFLEENVQIEWDAQRKRIYEHFGLGRQSEDMAASQSTFGRSARGAFGRSTRKGRSMGPAGASPNASFGTSTAAPVLGSINSSYQQRAMNGALDKSVGPGQGTVPDRFERDKQEQFAEKVKELNISRIEDRPYHILRSFYEVEKGSDTEHQEHFLNTYKALISITGEKDTLSGTNKARERAFAREYLDDNPNSANSVNIRKRILTGSRKFLEQKFLGEAVAVVAKHAGETKPGGIPSLLNKIRAYIQVKVSFKELGDVELLQRIGGDGEEFPWVILFYLLRAGLVQEASDYVRAKKNFFQNNDRIFALAMLYYADDSDRRLNPELQQKMNHVYAQRARISPTNDPFRMACYKIVGRCELTRRNLEPLPQTMDDWVWLQFNLAREGNRAEENAGEIFGLEEIRTSINVIGQRHFTSPTEAAGGYGVYFYLATLAGMFEQAINYLGGHNMTTAVHFAIALDFYGLLRVSDWSKAGSEILTFTQRQVPELNFGRIVGQYTGNFRMARADAAAEYLILICLNADLQGEAGKEQASLCHEALRELVLETREFSTLLGDVKANGEGTEGLIKSRLELIKLADENALIRNITQEAAKTADDNGRTNDAVLLCHLAGEYDLVVSILNRSLSEALSVDIGQEPLRLEPLKQRLTTANVPATDPTSTSASMLGTDDPIELAHRIITLYNNNQLWWRKVSKSNRDTLGMLYSLNGAKQSLEVNRYMEALDQIESLSLLPLTAAGNLSQIRSTANNFATYTPEIARNIGQVLLWAITCCSRHRATLLSGQFEDPTRRALADQLLQKAKDLMVFAGLIRFRLPPRVFETLAREGGEGVGVL